MLWYKCAETENMLGMLEKKYNAKMDPNNEDECYDEYLFVENRIVKTMNGIVSFRFKHEGDCSVVYVSFDSENYCFMRSDVDVFDCFLEGRMREIAFNANTIWNDPGTWFDAEATWNTLL